MTTTTVSGNSLVRATPGKFYGISVTSPPLYGFYSVHDCAGPGQALPTNAIFPQNFAADDSMNGISVRFGICVHSRAGSGTFVVTHSS